MFHVKQTAPGFHLIQYARFLPYLRRRLVFCLRCLPGPGRPPGLRCREGATGDRGGPEEPHRSTCQGHCATLTHALDSGGCPP